MDGIYESPCPSIHMVFQTANKLIDFRLVCDYINMAYVFNDFDCCPSSTSCFVSHFFTYMVALYRFGVIVWELGCCLISTPCVSGDIFVWDFMLNFVCEVTY